MLGRTASDQHAIAVCMTMFDITDMIMGRAAKNIVG